MDYTFLTKLVGHGTLYRLPLREISQTSWDDARRRALQRNPHGLAEFTSLLTEWSNTQIGLGSIELLGYCRSAAAGSRSMNFFGD